MGSLWNREPVLFMTVIQAALALLLAFGVSLSPAQIGAILAFSAAVIGFIVRSQVTPTSGATAPLSISPSSVAKLSMVLCAVLIYPACASAPPTLSPVGVRAFQETRVIKAADLFRDFAIDANAQTPPLLDTATTRKIVTWHESAVKIIAASNVGWQATVSASADAIVSGVSAADAAKIAPYVSLVKSALKEIQ